MNKKTMPTPADRKVDAQDAAERAQLSKVAAGDRDALAALYRQYHPRLFKFVFRMTRSYSASDELVNDIMLAVWKKADSFRGDSKLSTWVFGIAYRQTLRRLSRKQLSIVPDIDMDELPDDLPDKLSGTLEKEDWVQHGLQHLPAAQQLTMVLVFYLGLSYEETAVVTECPVNTVKTRMFHARRKLKEQLARLATPVEGDNI